ncbi:MupA/Atu3671 family FMN-dependent luciferase-like monooxygenase [Actinoplanes couchii]|uniref:Siderophore biosynthesis protein n=1 Tax=Actinoplanes couchii TaxID=403638 RepID=A0ABQ3XBR8_9ACTN|nr:MupA/Atu3671 family FMN-dependent luciferase-like monooxygenase [Actinoplanes couchii]MDR6323395.1 natural product biosynthesis luciferase-like monooxygenase protein [Actinoplanes couchii]GID55910.1 siderophore biosynthesis protein [Actinoplanes couchii]
MMDFGLFYFADDSGAAENDRYRLLLDGARFADENGFHAVWTPERHFHQFGGTYPNPSVTGAAIAATTSRVQVRAGSVVAPLHHPVRIAEEWSVVDNLSHGRAGVSFASGWHATDFALNPSAYQDRRTVMYERIEQVRALWRGESVEVVDGLGNPGQVRSFPPPVRGELPVWVTSVGDVETFRSAGRIRAGLLTHLLGQSPEQLAEKIVEYRKAATEASDGAWTGHVVAMVHTFLGEDDDAVREQVRPSLSAYMRSSLRLILSSDLGPEDVANLEADEIDFLVERAFEHYFDNIGLLGSVDKAQRIVANLAELGVDEVACLIDFGLPADEVLSGLTHLKVLRDACG